jgi:hypothetical protein
VCPALECSDPICQANGTCWFTFEAAGTDPENECAGNQCCDGAGACAGSGC